MAKKISQLTQATEVKSDDVTVIVQDGETKKLPLNMMVTKQDIENKKIAGLAKLDEIEATYENDTYTPTITVKNKSSVKTGEGDEVDYSANVMDGHVKSAILKGSTKYRDIDTGEFLETFEEGRNLELVSVKMPVLTTTGKNLFDKSKTLENCALEGTSNVVLEGWKDYFVSDYIPVKKNVPIFIPYTGSSRKVYCDKNKEYVRQITNSDSYFIPEFDGFIRLTFINVDLNAYQLEYNTQATSYEPYKSNILSAPEDLELRGIGNVKDELNVATGELTQRIGEVVLDGNIHIDNQSIHGINNTLYVITFRIPGLNGINGNYNFDTCITDKFNTHYGFLHLIDGDWGEGVAINGRYIRVVINSDKLPSLDTTGINSYFTEHPLTVCYKLAKESIKTVDLMPSGTHPSTTPYCWKNGHIQLSSSGLLPNLEYSVVTSRAGQINQNATMIVKNDKRIFDLEILLAGGLVNTTYQALTLQNQVETGLSKVSLNSETEPDYLLYHMIMKLIEEKAYKLDDLTEKVSVFYLYEKLSDEQFETIYSALYPFVEDKIVEEPVVEELPEVVEDEVIM